MSDLAHEEPLPIRGTLTIGADGRYLDADPGALDLLGVTLDVLRQKRVGDFSDPRHRHVSLQLWTGWINSSATEADGAGTAVLADGRMFRGRHAMVRRADGTTIATMMPVDEPPSLPPAVRVRTVLDRWRQVEQELTEVAAGDPATDALQAQADALREEYQRRVGGR